MLVDATGSAVLVEGSAMLAGELGILNGVIASKLLDVEFRVLNGIVAFSTLDDKFRVLESIIKFSVLDGATVSEELIVILCGLDDIVEFRVLDCGSGLGVIVGVVKSEELSDVMVTNVLVDVPNSEVLVGVTDSEMSIGVVVFGKLIVATNSEVPASIVGSGVLVGAIRSKKLDSIVAIGVLFGGLRRLDNVIATGVPVGGLSKLDRMTATGVLIGVISSEVPVGVIRWTVTKLVVIVSVTFTGDGNKVVTRPLETVVVEKTMTGVPVIVCVVKTKTVSRASVLPVTFCLRCKVLKLGADGFVGLAAKVLKDVELSKCVPEL